MEDPENLCSWNASFLWERVCWFPGRFLKALAQILNILRDYGWFQPLWPLWASATLLVFRNLATKRWIVLLWGTLFLPKSLLHCRCVRRTDFVAKGATIFINDFYLLLCSIASSWIHINLKKSYCLHLKNMKKHCEIQLWEENKIEHLFWTTLNIFSRRFYTMVNTLLFTPIIKPW